MRQRSISILSVQSRFETKLVTQTSFREKDCIRNGFCTGTIPEVKIHYIETKTKLQDESNEYISYCVFLLRADFWRIMDATGGIPPISIKNIQKRQHMWQKHEA